MSREGQQKAPDKFLESRLRWWILPPFFRFGRLKAGSDGLNGEPRGYEIVEDFRSLELPSIL